MGTGASKNQRSTVVSNCQQPTRLNNRAQNRRASRRESEEPEYVLLPGLKHERFYTSGNNPRNVELLRGVPTASSSAPGENSNALLGGTLAKDRAGIDNSSPDSTSSISSSKSVTKELDALQTELDQVLMGHYFATNKSAAGVLRTAEIAALERHNQLQPLPQDYKPVIRDTTKDGHTDSDWVRPLDLVRQERDLADRKKREVTSFEQDTKEEEKEEETQSSLNMYDMEDEQERGDFDVQKFQAVNIPKEPITEGVDIFSQTTYKNYSSSNKKQVTSEASNINPRISEIAGTSTLQIYNPSEEELLKSIEQELF